MSRIPRFLIAFVFALSSLPLHASAWDKDRAAVLGSLQRIHLGDNGAAWHMRTAVQLYPGGFPGDKGTVDVIRETNGDTRTIYAFPGFKQAVTSTTRGRAVEGDLGDAPAGMPELFEFLEHPSRTSSLRADKLSTFNKKKKDITLHCTEAYLDLPDTMMHKRTVCVSKGSPQIRLAELNSSYAVYFEQVGTFANGDVPVSAVLFYLGIPIARMEFTFTPLSANDGDIVSKNVALDRSQDPGFFCNTGFINRNVSTSDQGHPIAVLLRLSLDAGSVTNAQIVATNDLAAARKTVATVMNQQITGQTACRYLNYTYRRFRDVENIDYFSALNFGDH